MARNLQQKKEQLPSVIDFSQDASDGLDNLSAADFAIPYLVILQKMSPQLDTHDVKAGQIWNTVTEKGVDIYRMKGVIAIYGDPNKYVYHAVHMIFSGAYTDPWGDEERCCKLMFIGKNLNREELEEGFNKCRVEGSAPKKQKTSA